MAVEAVPKTSKAEKTRTRIIQAAFDRFSIEGYAATGLREIAEIAGVVPSLIVRHFGSKALLFERVLSAALAEHGLSSYSKDGFGMQVARHISHREDGRLTAMIILAIGDRESKEVTQRVCKEIVIDAMADWLGHPNGRSRAVRALILMNGFVVQTRHMMSEDIPEELVEWLGRSIQSIVDEP